MTDPTPRRRQPLLPRIIFFFVVIVPLLLLCGLCAWAVGGPLIVRFLP